MSEIWSNWLDHHHPPTPPQHSTILWMGNIDDQHRNPNMNKKDHTVRQLTSFLVCRHKISTASVIGTPVICITGTANFYRTRVNLGPDLSVRMSVTPTPCADLTDVTLAGEDTN